MVTFRVYWTTFDLSQFFRHKIRIFFQRFVALFFRTAFYNLKLKWPETASRSGRWPRWAFIQNLEWWIDIKFLVVIRLRELAPYTIWQNDLRAQFCPPPLTKPTHCTSALDCPSVCTMGWHPCWRKFSWTNFSESFKLQKYWNIVLFHKDRIVHGIGMLLQKQFHPIAHGTYYGHLMLCFTRCSIILYLNLSQLLEKHPADYTI